MKMDLSFKAPILAFLLSSVGSLGLPDLEALAAVDPAAACATSKHKAAAKKLSAKVKCHGTAIKKGIEVDATCLGKAETKFNEAFAKAEGKGGCATTGDVDTIEALIDQTLSDLLNALPPATTTTTLPSVEICDNGQDDDGDTFVDCDDTDCDPDPLCAPLSETCDNGQDDDGDTLVDCDDPNCTGDPACAPAPELVLNEIDYDQAGIDGASFVEIYNPTAAPVSLSTLALVLVNGGSMAEYLRVDLSAAGATLPADGYLVVRNASVPVAGGPLTIDVAGDWIQNGPDGVALIDTASSTLIDSLCYEGDIAAASIVGFPGTTNLVEGEAFAGGDTNDDLNSVARSPNGSDTDLSSADWTLTTTITPGTSNP